MRARLTTVVEHALDRGQLQDLLEDRALAHDAMDASRVYRETEVDKRPRQTAGDRISVQPRLRSGDSVSVTLSFVVDDSGAVRDVKIEESGGEEIDAAHLAAVRTWRFEPGEKDGVKVKVRLVRKYTYGAG